MSEGWISLHRGWRDNPIFRGEYSRADAWVWLIENACWKPTRARIKGEVLELQRGELTFSQRFLAEKWGWSKSRVDRFIAELREEGMIETRSKNGATANHNAGQGQCIIKLCNYAKYQDQGEAERGNSGPRSGATAGQQRGKEEQGNKGTSDKVAKATPSLRAKAPAVIPHRMPVDWVPAPLPPDIAELVAEWPPGRLEREAAGTRDYWSPLKTKRPGWELTFHNRIRDIHDRVMRDTGNDRPSKAIRGSSANSAGRSSLARAIDEGLEFLGGGAQA